jgi:hypothetical protein
MSIFKSTFKPFVIRQINTRQSLLSETSTPRPVEFANYVSSKSPWIKMTSFVDYEGSNKLAKSRVLMGGTLYNDGDKYSLRSGIGVKGGAYGIIGTTQYGIRPMPGITGLTTRSLGAYGSLAEATIKFYAWDVKQLEDLSILFMRPGYKVLLEWGWSMFLDTSVPGEDYKKPASINALKDKSNYKIVTSPLSTVECFDENITQDYIYDRIDLLRQQYSANYDGVLGSITNFEYTLMPNGGFECMTKLISIGDVIDTIRINNVTTDAIGSSVQQSEPANPNETNANQTQSPKEDIKTQFELLMDLYCNIDENNPRTNNPIITEIDNAIPQSEVSNIDYFIYKYNINKGTYRLTEGADAANQAMFESLFVGSMREELSNDTVTPEAETTPPTADQTAPVSEYVPGDLRRKYYMQFSYFLHILNILKNIFTEKQQTLVTIEIPGAPKDAKLSNGLCQASYNSISIDPNTAMIRNPKAALFTSKDTIEGFLPEIYKTEYGEANKAEMEEYLYENTNFGLIKNVYLNIGCIVDTYKKQSVANNGNVYLGELIDELLTKISFSLGSINDFGKIVLNNKVVIIDKHYTEISSDSLYDSKFKINISGNNSIVRSHKIQSKIFPSQATMMAIAAQDRENVASLQSSTYNYLNKGLKDRLFVSSTDSKSEKDNSKETTEYYKKLYDNILSLIYYVNNYVIPNQSINPQYYFSNVNAMNSYLNTLLVQIERGTDYKAVVPISVEMTIDGLSGFTIGQIFTVNKDVLPRDYENKSVGFIVTGISNDVNTHSWTTTITSQMCLLDQDKRQESSKNKADAVLRGLQGRVNANKAANYNSIRYYNILAALVIDVLRGGFSVVDINGNIEKQNITFYTIAATQTYTPGVVSFENLIGEFTNNYLLLYPKTSIEELTDVPTTKEGQVEANITVKYFSDRVEYYAPEYIAIKYVKTDSIGFVTASNTDFRYSNLKNKDLLKSIIDQISYYKTGMVPEIKRLFDSEFERVLGDFESNNYRVLGQENIIRELRTKEDAIDFRILDIKSVDDKTGFIKTPIQLYEGYQIKKSDRAKKTSKKNFV